ncbi:MAG: rod shape-determining protein RodA [Vicinamibacteraceae bacterium]
MIDQRLSRHIDWLLLVAVVLLAIVGLAMIHSTTYNPAPRTPTWLGFSSQVWTQAAALAAGVVAMVATITVDFRRFTENAIFFYAIVAAVLLYVLLFGTAAGGARRWISLGGFSLQPSAFAAIPLALVLAVHLGENRLAASRGSDLAVAGAFVGGLFVLIARQPDLGSAITLLPVFVGMVFVAGLRLRLLGVLLAAGLVLSPIVWKYGMEDYQRERVVAFLDPTQDPLGAGYQQIQARITVGSGGLAGKGFLQGTQGQYRFLPVAHNDFIYSVLAEEQGFLGVLATLALYLFVIVRSIDAARLAKDRTGAYLVIGLISGFAFQVVYNITMSAGLAPVKGLTLPLMSYGGSSLIATFVTFGLILNVRMRRFTN